MFFESFIFIVVYFKVNVKILNYFYFCSNFLFKFEHCVLNCSYYLHKCLKIFRSEESVCTTNQFN